MIILKAILGIFISAIGFGIIVAIFGVVILGVDELIKKFKE
jgi:hypothetical protein